ncbi:hypothetical protein UFOVP451_3 [uncultured Caudovirales phage]|uniref:Uncharacterized protein n=1 Tax=uncultured Caudovirales phage TaxID=2100421 RepID=A0A6J5M6F8_9CAUD|nr:hypothetical protein UFOVP451_3 [uncultured Caudovirales phage]
MGASKFPNDQNSKLVDENGLPIDATNPLDVQLSDNTFKLVDPVNPLNAAFVDSSGNLQVEVNNFPATQPISGNVGITGTPTVYVDTETLPGGGKKSLSVTGAVTVLNSVSGDAALPLIVGGTVKLDQAAAGANHVELVDAAGGVLGQSSANPLVVSAGTTPVVNMAGDVLDVEIKSGSNTAAVDANGKLAVNINAGGTSPSVVASISSIITSDKLNVKTTGTDTVAVTGSVNIGTMPAITVSDVGIKTTANTVKIDQATAGANNIKIVDTTNSTHVAKVSNNGSVHTVITNDNASAIPTTITNTPNVNVSTLPVVRIDQATANANHVEIVDSGGVSNQATNPLYTSTVLKDGANQAVIDASGVLSVKFPSAQNVSVSNTPSVRVDQSVAGANHVEIVNAGGLANSAVEPLFTSTTITNTPNVTVANASVNVSASANLPVQGTVAISTINGIAPAIDASGNLSIEIAGTGNTVGLSTSANEIKINQATPNANHVEIVNSAGAVNGAANPLFTKAEITNDVFTIPETRYDMTQTGNSQTFWYSDFTLLNTVSQTLILGITGFKIRVDKVIGTIDPSLTSTAYGKSFQLRQGGNIICNLVTQSAGTAGLAEQFVFEPPAGGLFIQSTQSLSLYNEDTAAGGTGSNFRVTVFGAYV